MSASRRSLACGLAAALISASLPVQAHHHGHPGGYRPAPAVGWHSGGRAWTPPHAHPVHRRGWHRPGLTVGIGLGLGLGAGSIVYSHSGLAGAYVYGGVPGVVYTVPAPALQAYPAPVEPALPSPPEPVIYPRLQQSPEQTEFDRRECNRWALAQANALAEASVFHRATLACMEGRGYTVR